MKCQVCSAEAVAGAVFCRQCGAKLPLLDPGGANALPPSGSGSSGDETAAESAATATNAAAPLLEVEYSPKGMLESIIFRATAAPLRRRQVTNVPEETLWEGGYSPKAMLGTIILYAVIGVALIVASEAIVVAWASIWEHWIVSIGVILLLMVMLLFIIEEFEEIIGISIISLALAGALVVFSKYLVILPKYWIVSIEVMLVFVIVLAQFVARRLGGQYKLTNQMFYHKEGVLTRTSDRIEAIDIDCVTWTQGLVERIVNVGTVVIRSREPDTNASTHHSLCGIDNVEQVAQMIDQARLAERARRNLLNIQEQNVDTGA